MHVCTGELQRPQSREPTTRKPTLTGRLYCECDLNVFIALSALCLRIFQIDEQLETPKSELTLGSQLGNGGCGVRQ